jgi:hypothetical protein
MMRFWRLDELVAGHSEVRTGCPVTYTYSCRQGRNLLESAQFRVTDIFVDHIFPYRILDDVQYQYVKTWLWTWTPCSVFSWMELRFGWHLCLTGEVRGRA